jgi:hypothetical protein
MGNAKLQLHDFCDSDFTLKSSTFEYGHNAGSTIAERTENQRLQEFIAVAGSVNDDAVRKVGSNQIGQRRS